MGPIFRTILILTARGRISKILKLDLFKKALFNLSLKYKSKKMMLKAKNWFLKITLETYSFGRYFQKLIFGL